MKHTIPHDLEMDLLRRATQKAMDSYSQRFEEYQPRANWTSENDATITFEAKGIRLEGDLELGKSEIELELDVPFLFKPFRKRAIALIDSEIRKWLEKARNGELDEA